MSEAAPQPRPNWPLRLTYAAAALTVLLLVGSPLGVRWYVLWSGESHLAAAIAEADRLDPGWRWEELEAKRAEVPEAENSALLVRRAGSLIPKNWMATRQLPTGESLSIEFDINDVPPNHLLCDRLLKYLREEVEKARDAVALGRQLAYYPRGRFTWTTLNEGSLPWDSSDVQAAGQVARLLTFDARLRALDGDVDGAFRQCMAALNAGRSMGDFSLSITWLTRRGTAASTIACMERVLALGTADRQTLSDLQAELQKERDEPALIDALRGSRAELVLQMRGPKGQEFLETMEVFSVRLKDLGKPREESEDEDWRAELSQWCHDFLWPKRAILDENVARALRHATEAVEIAKLPPSRHFPALKRMAAERGRLEDVTGIEWRMSIIAMPSVDHKVAIAVLKCQAGIDCAIVALASERFRLDRGRWPEQLSELVPEYLAAIAIDPFTGDQVRLRQKDDGIIIYSLDEDECDDAGTRRGEVPYGSRKTYDIGFRLWGPRFRRMLPPPPNEEMPPPPPPLEEILP